MKSMLFIAILIFTANSVHAQDRGEGKDVWGQTNARKEPLFDKPVRHHSKAYKKEQERRTRADAVAIIKRAHDREKTPNYKVVPPLTIDEVYYMDIVRVKCMRECRLVNPPTNFDILIRHRWDRNFAGSALGYKVLNGNAW